MATRSSRDKEKALDRTKEEPQRNPSADGYLCAADCRQSANKRGGRRAPPHPCRKFFRRIAPTTSSTASNRRKYTQSMTRLGLAVERTNSPAAALYDKKHGKCQEQEIPRLPPETQKEKGNNRRCRNDVTKKEEIQPWVGNRSQGNAVQVHFRSHTRPNSSNEIEMAAETSR